jgi:hypothetical protein
MLPNSVSFETLEARAFLDAVAWTGLAGDSLWHTPLNWSSLAVPGPADDVTIDAPLTPTIRFTQASGERVINTLLIRDGLTVTGGALRVSGAARVEGPLTLDGGELTLGAGVVTSGAAWGAGRLSGSLTIMPGATLTTFDSAPRTLAASLTIEGTFTHASSSSVLCDNSLLTIAPTGQLLWTGIGNLNDAASSTGNPPSNLINNGLIVKSNPTAVTLAPILTNNATLRIDGGPVLIARSGTLGGSVTVAAGASLVLTAGMVYPPTAVLSGAGDLTIGGGAHNFPAGTLLITGLYSLTLCTLTINNAINPSGTLLIPNTVSIYFEHPQELRRVTSSGLISGSAPITITEQFTWNSGRLEGASPIEIAPSATMIGSGNGRFLARNLINRGTVTFQGPGTMFFAGATLTNLATLTLNASVSNGAGVNSFVNSGTIDKTSTNTITMTAPFTNTGSINLHSGTITFTNLANFSSNSLTGGAWYIGNGATLNVNGAFITSLGAGTSLTLDGPLSSLPQATSLSVNRGTLTLRGGRDLNFTSAGGVFRNIGTLVKDGGLTTSVLNTTLFENTGTLRIASGVLAIAIPITGAGSLMIDAGGEYRALNTQAFANVSNTGILTLEQRTLTVTRTYTQSGQLNISIGLDTGSVPSPLIGRIVSPSATLLPGSQLTIAAVNGFDAAGSFPSLRVNILEAGTRTGTFSDVTLPDTGFGTYALLEPGASIALAYNFADANADGGVDGADIEFFFEYWSLGNSFADVNGDGGVDGSDIQAFFDLWSVGGPG